MVNLLIPNNCNVNFVASQPLSIVFGQKVSDASYTYKQHLACMKKACGSTWDFTNTSESQTEAHSVIGQLTP